MAALIPNTLYGIDNARNRAFVVGVDSTVNGININYFLIDSGCNTNLLNIREGELDTVLAAFPQPEYIYDIHSGGGVATVQDCVLNIRSSSNTNSILWNLSPSFNPYNFTTAFTRFHLCYDDAVSMLNKHRAGTIVLGGSSRLGTYINTMDVVSAAVVGFQYNRRRKHALLGRTAMNLIGNGVLQRNGVTIASNNITNYNITDADLLRIRDLCLNHMQTHMIPLREDFDDLENQYDPDITNEYGDADEYVRYG